MSYIFKLRKFFKMYWASLSKHAPNLSCLEEKQLEALVFGVSRPLKGAPWNGASWMSASRPPSPPEKIRKILESETRLPKRWSPGPSCPTRQTPGIALMIILRMSWCVMWQGERYASHKIGRSDLEMFGNYLRVVVDVCYFT